MNFQIRTNINHPFSLVANNFSEDLFNALAPPLMPSKLLEFDGDRIGGLVRIQMGVSPLATEWVSKIISRSQNEDKLEFEDIGLELPPPLKKWRHKHIVKRLGNAQSEIIDDITFSCGSKIKDALMYPLLYGMFALRIPAYKKYFNELAG